MTQRQPRIQDPAYLAYVRTLPCLVCRRPGPNDPAHLRSAARQYGKRPTGMGEKSDDKWALPLCRYHHDEQHRTNELRWWARQGIADPFVVAEALYASRPNRAPPRPTSAPKGARVRKVASRRLRGRPLESRSNWQPGRKIMSGNSLRAKPHP